MSLLVPGRETPRWEATTPWVTFKKIVTLGKDSVNKNYLRSQAREGCVGLRLQDRLKANGYAG